MVLVYMVCQSKIKHTRPYLIFFCAWCCVCNPYNFHPYKCVFLTKSFSLSIIQKIPLLLHLCLYNMENCRFTNLSKANGEIINGKASFTEVTVRNNYIHPNLIRSNLLNTHYKLKHYMSSMECYAIQGVLWAWVKTEQGHNQTHQWRMTITHSSAFTYL